MKTLKSIARGVALLDEKVPGWEDRISLDKLNLSSSCNCVCGQLIRQGPMGSRYMRMARQLGLYDQNDGGERHGFLANGQTSFERLTDEWTRVIRAKRAGEEITSA